MLTGGGATLDQRKTQGIYIPADGFIEILNSDCDVVYR
jgi:hypothetical protein